MLLGGAVAGQGAIDVYLLIAIAWFCAWPGDTTSFFLGRRLGRDFVLTPRAARRDQPRALRTGRGLLLPPRRQDDPHRPLHQPGPRLRPVHRRQLGDALPRLRSLQHPRHRPLGDRPHPDRLPLLAQHRDAPPSTPARRLPARHPDRRRRRRGRPRPPSAVAENRRRRGALDGGRTRRPAGWSTSAAASARSALPLGPADAGRPFGLEFTSLMATLAVSLFVLIAYTGRRRRRPGPDPGRPDRLRLRRPPAHRLPGRRREGHHLPRLGRFVWRADRSSARSCSPLAAAGPRSASCSPGWR